MSGLLCIDPGVRGIGWAYFNTGPEALLSCGYFKNKKAGKGPVQPNQLQEMAVDFAVEWRSPLHSWKAPARVVVEWPQVYQGAKQKGDPNDILMVAAVSSALLTAFEAATVDVSLDFVRPSTWKGQVNADVMTSRILAALDDTERLELKAAKVPKSLEHNTIDAIGIGLALLGRLGTKKIFRGDE